MVGLTKARPNYKSFEVEMYCGMQIKPNEKIFTVNGSVV